MTYPQSSGQLTTPEREEDTDTRALVGEIGRGVFDSDPKTSIGLTELHAMETAFTALEALGADGRSRAFKWLGEALNIATFQHSQAIQQVDLGTQLHPVTAIEGENHVTPREFLSQKKPESLVERVACLLIT